MACKDNEKKGCSPIEEREGQYREKEEGQILSKLLDKDSRKYIALFLTKII